MERSVHLRTSTYKGAYVVLNKLISLMKIAVTYSNLIKCKRKRVALLANSAAALLHEL
jgi:hypothetical protein